MSAVITNFFSDKIIDQLVGLPNAKLGLHIANPTLGGLAANEVNSIGYVRQNITWSIPGNRTVAVANGITYPVLQPATINYFGIWKGIELWLAIPCTPQIIATANSSLYIPPAQIAFTIPT